MLLNVIIRAFVKLLLRKGSMTYTSKISVRATLSIVSELSEIVWIFASPGLLLVMKITFA